MRLIAVIVSAAFAATCGRTPTLDNSANKNGTQTPPPPPDWKLAGRIVATGGNGGVGGATVKAGELSTTTDGNGTFELRRATAPASPLAITVSAPGFVTRETQVKHPHTDPLVIDIIADREPFDMAFYRALVRDSMEGNLYGTLQWTRDVTFYVKTIDDTGRQMEPEVLAIVRQHLPAAFAAWTSGRFTGHVEEGKETRTDTPGVVRVTFIRKPEELFCGRATVGGNYGWMKLYLDGCDCGSRKVDPAVIWHEVGHTAGFWHVDGQYLMNPTVSTLCNFDAKVTDHEQVHARIAYGRPRDNQDPDKDPEWFAFVRPGTIAPREIACAR